MALVGLATSRRELLFSGNSWRPSQLTRRPYFNLSVGLAHQRLRARTSARLVELLGAREQVQGRWSTAMSTHALAAEVVDDGQALEPPALASVAKPLPLAE
jgi:hypothetical protein